MARRPSKKHAPVVRDDSKLATMLLVARHIAVDVEKVREALRNNALSSDHREALKERMFEATDRLSNLMGLISLRLLETSASDDMKQVYRDQMDALRTRTVQLGASIMIERVAAIRDRALDILDSDEYPLGCVFPLRLALVEILTLLESLGNSQVIETEDIETMDDAVASFNRLLVIEKRFGMPDFSAKRPMFDPMSPLSIKAFPGIAALMVAPPPPDPQG